MPEASEKGLHEPTHSHAPVKLMLFALLVLGIIALGWIHAEPASAHEPGRKTCREYQQMHAFVTGSATRGAAAGRACRLKTAAHVLTHPLPDALIPVTVRLIRACESGARTAAGKAIDGTFDYTAQNPSSTASGGYGYLDTTWDNHLGYAKARLAPPRVQDRRIIRDVRVGGLSPWETSRGCWS